jgi:hypothetical protein
MCKPAATHQRIGIATQGNPPIASAFVFIRSSRLDLRVSQRGDPSPGTMISCFTNKNTRDELNAYSIFDVFRSAFSQKLIHDLKRNGG